MEEALERHAKSIAAPLVFFIVGVFQFLSRYLEIRKTKTSISDKDAQLKAEIRQLTKEANALSQPSTFAQAAKLKRMAAAKEKELAKSQGIYKKETKMTYDMYTNCLLILKVFTYSMLLLWFWRVPVASVSKQLVQPFGKMLSWRAGGFVNDNVMVGIIPWLILCTRVSKTICRKVLT
ncbi:unnamed protein product [Cuscuta campestris]|uniref:Tail-anchored protein insertion receptor WRB n=2 Tax=Cuscuta sect. Cleistogrammica TaxID=1824901 RepID=A0A484NHC5_9ASTE|nr:hypothetical protein DM860_004746 [Cuscuta australis]VFQ99796.1 unnamed protein product [Cuscuta campestris]